MRPCPTPTIAALLAALATFGISPHAFAEAGFVVDRFEPAPRGSDWFVGDSLDLRGAPNFAAGIVADWSYKALSLSGADAEGVASPPNVLTDRVLVHSGVSLIFHDRWRFALDLPLLAYQWGEASASSAAGLSGLRGSGVGDLRLAADGRIFGKYGDVFTAAWGVFLYVPTGARAKLTSDGTWRVTPRLLVAGDRRGFVYAGQLAYAVRPLEEQYLRRNLGSEASFSLAAGVRVNDMFVLGPELFGSTVLTSGEAFSRRATPLELLLGLHVKLADHWQFGSAIGPGLSQGDGCPSLRVLLSLELAPDVCVDADGDGICAPADACPDVAGVRTGRRSTNGCPAAVPAPAIAPTASPPPTPPK